MLDPLDALVRRSVSEICDAAVADRELSETYEEAPVAEVVDDGNDVVLLAPLVADEVVIPPIALVIV